MGGVHGERDRRLRHADEGLIGSIERAAAGSGAGGTNDIVTRLVGTHIKRHLGGEPNIVVKNMP